MDIELTLHHRYLPQLEATGTIEQDARHRLALSRKGGRDVATARCVEDVVARTRYR